MTQIALYEEPDPAYFVNDVASCQLLSEGNLDEEVISGMINENLEGYFEELNENLPELLGMRNGIFVVFQIPEEHLENPDKHYIFGYFTPSPTCNYANRFLDGDINALETALTEYLIHDDVSGFQVKEEPPEPIFHAHRDSNTTNNEHRVIVTDEYLFDTIKQMKDRILNPGGGCLPPTPESVNL